MRRARPPLPLAWAAGLGAALAILVALYFVFVAVSLPGDSNGTTSEKARSEALVLATGACLGYAGSGLVRYLRGRRVRWAPVAAAYLLGALATPVALIVLIADFSGG